MTLARATLPIPWTHALVWGNVFFIVHPDSAKSLLTSDLVGGKKFLTVTHHRRAIIFWGGAIEAPQSARKTLFSAVALALAQDSRNR